MYGYIYKTTNLINGKVYIGQHKSTDINDKYLGSGKLIKRAINEYGKENFKKEVLITVDTKEELDKYEILFIEKYNSRNKNIGYNLTQGGQDRFFTGCKHSKESKQKMSIKAKNRPHPPTTDGRVWIHMTNQKEKMVKLDELNTYLDNGYELNRISQVGGWSKGLTKETNKSVNAWAVKRQEVLKEKPIGFCGYGNDNYMYKKFLEKVNNINREEFLEDLNTIGKCKTCEKYHISNNKYKETLEILNITDIYSYKLKKTE